MSETYWSGICLECYVEWTGMEEQSCCPCCNSTRCDLMEESHEGDGIVSEGRAVGDRLEAINEAVQIVAHHLDLLFPGHKPRKSE